ncbi:10102_t:CDS:2 [Entrophospora sp. SA101]|nr:10102_t:CDS:2 [Entrophospora sp. SA101]
MAFPITMKNNVRNFRSHSVHILLVLVLVLDSKYHINKYLSKRPIGVPKNLYLHIGMKLIFGHKNIQGIHAYKEVNKTQNLATMNTLTHAIKPTRSLILIDSTRNM